MPLLLAILSITMMVSTSYDDGIVISREVIVQSAAYVIGIGLILIIINIDYTVFQDVIKWIYIGSIVLLLLVYVPFIGVEHFGARSWINLGFMDIQPSEIVKITFMILLADYLEKHKNDLRTFTGLGKVIRYCAPFIIIVVKVDIVGFAFAAVGFNLLFLLGVLFVIGFVQIFKNIDILFRFGLFLRSVLRDITKRIGMKPCFNLFTRLIRRTLRKVDFACVGNRLT